MTALDYDDLLTRLYVIEAMPAWETNRLKRLTRTAKRYVIEPALIAAALRLDVPGVLRDGNLLGRLLDTFVAAQLRAETAVSESRPRLYHLRTQSSREEIDLVAELGGGRVIGVEVKADAAPDRRAARHLRWLRDRLGERFVAGVVLHTGPRAFELDAHIVAAPISAIWA
jgi:predicted AAA+ superfamily ATPase